jgi:hypothetical protein
MNRKTIPMFVITILAALTAILGLTQFAAGVPAHGTTYATWMMIWHGSDQGWWKADMTPQVQVGDEWKALDWVDQAQVEAHLDGIKNAGVSVVIVDLTNGWKWLDGRCKLIQSLCAKKGLKFCVGENSDGNMARFESHAQDVWDNFAGPLAANHDTYFQYHGKPLIVCYGIRSWVKDYQNSTGRFRRKFNLVWSSGEDSEKDKWGWQLEPWVGSIPSKDSMFVTSSVKWNSTDPNVWRKSLAWLDYNFALARKSKPDCVIIGSYDDPTERNGWLIADTSKGVPGLQMRDKTGALSKTAHYKRVKQWTSGQPDSEPGGLLKDGAYRISPKTGGGSLGVIGKSKEHEGDAGASIGVKGGQNDPRGLVWFYHLGGNHYRLIVLESGLALEARDGAVIQDSDSTNKTQKWTLSRAESGCYRLVNDANGAALTLKADSPASLHAAGNEEDQLLVLQGVLTLAGSPGR